jgi:hypothetical protein
MTNALACTGMRWQPSAAESALGQFAAAPAPAQAWAAAKPQAHGNRLPAAADVAVRLRGYSFAIRPRGTPPV